MPVAPRRPDAPSAPAWMHRVVGLARTDEPVHGIDDPAGLRRIIGGAVAIWGVGIAAFLGVMARDGLLNVTTVTMYLLLGPILLVGQWLGGRCGRMPGFVPWGVVLWVSLLGAVSSYWYWLASITAVALSTAFVSWFGSRVAPLYGITCVVTITTVSYVRAEDLLFDRALFVLVVMAFGLSIVSQSSDESRQAHQDREILLARLAHESRMDELTGIGNRKRLLEEAMLVLERRDVDMVGLAIIDLDDFKPVNDRYGHLVGDRVLQHIASRLVTAAGPDAVVARMGGDEFAVLFSGSGLTPGAIDATLQPAVDGELVVDGRTIQTRASVGVAVRERHATDLEELLTAADTEMYAAKQSRATSRKGR